MFYILLFSILAVLLVIAGMAAVSRNRSAVEPHHATNGTARRTRKARRSQSRHDRRKRG